MLLAAKAGCHPRGRDAVAEDGAGRQGALPQFMSTHPRARRASTTSRPTCPGEAALRARAPAAAALRAAAEAELRRPSRPDAGLRCRRRRVLCAPLVAERALRPVPRREAHLVAERPKPRGDGAHQVSKSPCGKSVRPMLPANSTSPTKACLMPGSKNTTWPGVWPGQWRTCSPQPPMRTVSPSCSQRVGVKGSASGKPNMRLCCGSASIQNWSASCGPSMGRPSVRASVPVAPAWSMCAWVSQICSSVRPSSFTAASSTSMSPPGSITAACAWRRPRPASSSAGRA